MKEILEKAQGLKYTSFEYIDLEDIEEVLREHIIEDPEYIFMYKLDSTKYHIYWAAETKDGFLKGLDKITSLINKENVQGNTLHMEFVPPEFVSEMENSGFEIECEYVDYWSNNLDDVKINSFIHQNGIRKISEAEYESVSKVTKACKGYSRGFNGENSEFAKEWNETENSCILVSELNNEIAGVCFLNIYGFESEKGPVLWLREIAVDPKYHQRGIAHSLIANAFKWGIENGAKRSFLACDTENTKAIKVYENFGYKRKDGRGQINMNRHI